MEVSSQTKLLLKVCKTNFNLKLQLEKRKKYCYVPVKSCLQSGMALALLNDIIGIGRDSGDILKMCLSFIIINASSLIQTVRQLD